MLEILTKITDGKGSLDDLDELEYLAMNIKKGAPLRSGADGSKPGTFYDEIF